MKQQVRNKLHGKAGFTLVELIVVIAILGILAGIGTVGYSGYIKKAHQAADVQMIGDVVYAFQLGTVSGNSGAGNAGVVLRYNAAPLVSGSAEEYLKAMFGDDLSGLKLQYDGWDGSADGGVNFISLAAGQKYASSVNDSAYLQNSSVPELLDNVRTVTTAASSFLSHRTEPAQKYTALKEALGEDESFPDLCRDAGLEITTNASGQTVLGDSVTDTQISNLMVMYVAKELSGMDPDDVVEMMLDSDNAPEGVSIATKMAVSYAGAKAVALGTGAEGMARFNQMNVDLQNATALNEVETAMSNFVMGDPDYMQKYVDYVTNNGDAWRTDAEAFSAIMGAVNAVSGDYTNADALSDENLYTSASVANQLNSYISAAGAAGSLSDDDKAALSGAGDGTVSVSMSYLSNGTARIAVAPSSAYSGS